MNIQALMHDDIRSRDWARVHIAADRRSPVGIGDARIRSRGGERIVVRSQLSEVAG